MHKLGLVVALLAGFALSGAASAGPQWLTLPPTPALPASTQSGYAAVNGIKIWYAVFGQGKPVILLLAGWATPTTGATRFPNSPSTTRSS